MTHSDFAIGDAFVTTSGTWRCTDIGTRTVIAIKVSDGEDASWFRGPPYAVAEMVSTRTTGMPAGLIKPPATRINSR
jgi:hypothetical protein